MMTELRHLEENIQGTPCQLNPFPHLRFEKFFSAHTYQEILRVLPPFTSCHELRHRDAIGPDNHSTRLQFGFTAAEFHKLPQKTLQPWVELISDVAHPDVTEAVKTSLRFGMERRFGANWRAIKLKPVPWLIRDQTGYRIGIHPDHQGKIITLQIYLPADESQKGLGTTLYHQSQPLKHPRTSGQPAHDDDQDKFEVVHRIPFLPNTGYAFVVLQDSWHGVDRVTPTGSSRDSLMIHYVQS